MALTNFSDWNLFLANYPESHILQTSAWGELKSAFGWQPEYVLGKDCGAQILFRKLPLGFHIGYLPKGPVGKNWDTLWDEIDKVCQRRRTIFLKIEPDAWDGEEVGYRQSRKKLVASEPIQPRRTITIDLSGSEEQWLQRMKQKTRYNVRLAQRKGVEVHSSQDINLFYQMMLLTGKRDGFGVHSQSYYQRAYDLFYPKGECDLLIAEYQGSPLAALMVFAYGKRSWYLYGASNDLERNRMPTYLIQWEAMRWAAQKGCLEYDLWGVPDFDEENLEADFADHSDDLWGVYRFKRGFGGKVMRSVGAWDVVYMPALYRLYFWLIKRVV